MTPTLLVLAATVLGLVVGGGLTAVVFLTRAAGRRRAAAMRPELPEAAIEILNEIDTFAVILDASLTPVYVNPFARETRSVSGEELSTPDFLERARRVMSTGAPDTRVPDPNDPHDTVRMHTVRLHRRFLVVLVEDLGEEQRVNAMRRDFIANVSHELKTPIAAIGLLAEAIQQAADDPATVRGFSKSLVKEAKRLGTLSRDIIQLSEAQSALRPEEREPVAILELVRAEVEAHRTLAVQQGVDLVLEDDAALQQAARVLGRPASLGVAVANLLSNAIQHSPEGGRVGVGVRLEGRILHVSITDQGEGISPEHQPRIFERFYRVDDSRSRAGGGTGLGLSIARHTMRGHGGEIELWSQPGVGSTFTLSFPLIDEPDLGKPKKKKKKKKKAADAPAGALEAPADPPEESPAGASEGSHP